MGRFKGFSPKTMEFLMALGMNNSKTYFEANRHVYEEHLLQPMRDLAYDIAPHMLKIDEQFDVRPVIGGAISRIYRDARRVRGGPPYRDYMWLGYRPKMDKNSAAFYFDITPVSASVGLGVFGVNNAYMKRLRLFVKNNPRQYKKALKSTKGFEFLGKDYIRPPIESDDETIMQFLLKRRFHFKKNIPLKNTFRKEFPKELCEEFSSLQIMYDFLRRTNE